MIITKSEPFINEEIEKLKVQFGVYIKTVIDIEKKVCSAGCDRHFESEKVLLDLGSKQEDLWGGGIDLETKTIDFNSMINIRPLQNTSNEVQDKVVLNEVEKLPEASGPKTHTVALIAGGFAVCPTISAFAKFIIIT